MSQKKHIDEEDLDDLDDVLEQFSSPSTKGQAQTKVPSASSSSIPSGTKSNTAASSLPNPTSQSQGALDFSDDFTRELARGMESLMREIASDSGLDLEDGESVKVEGNAVQTEEEKKREDSLKAAWERMLVEGMNGALDIDELTGGAASKGKEKEAGEEAGSTTDVPADDDAFQASIRKAMEKLKESDSNLQADAQGSADDIMTQLTEGLNLGDGDSEEELHKVLESMMTQLMSKEILYDPLKELHTKFPEYMRDNATKISAEDKKRYDSQYAVVTKIVSIFEDPSYSEQDAEKGTQIVLLMNEMQSFGSPPGEIMGPMPPGLDFGPDGMPKLPDGCTIA